MIFTLLVAVGTAIAGATSGPALGRTAPTDGATAQYTCGPFEVDPPDIYWKGDVKGVGVWARRNCTGSGDWTSVCVRIKQLIHDTWVARTKWKCDGHATGVAHASQWVSCKALGAGRYKTAARHTWWNNGKHRTYKQAGDVKLCTSF